MYENKHVELIEENEIGKVKTIQDHVTSEYYRNAPNYYPIGTGITTSETIAMKGFDH